MDKALFSEKHKICVISSDHRNLILVDDALTFSHLVHLLPGYTSSFDSFSVDTTIFDKPRKGGPDTQRQVYTITASAVGPRKSYSTPLNPFEGLYCRPLDPQN